MKWIDILSFAMNNLLRRKLRSILTMLGVVIGTAAIVVTMSLGYGAQEAQMAMLEEETNLRLITVYPYYSYSVSSSANTQSNRITRINDSVIRRIRRVEGVGAVTPIVNLWSSIEFVIMTGDYECSTGIIAVLPTDFARIIGLKNGSYFTSRTDRMEFLMAEMSMLEFRDPDDDDYEYIDAWSYLYEGLDLPLPDDINWLRDRYTLQLRWEDYENTDENNPDPEVMTKDYDAKFMGTLDTSINDWTFSYGAVVNLNWLKRLQRDNKALFNEMGISDFSTYDQLYVLASTADDVVGVVSSLTEMGLQCSSPLDYLNTYMEQIQTVQGFLGFIGAISMLVAALSIANTMMMSIYERTREIGVMKVLGCKLKNIRAMFLMEAAYIGVFGGMMGIMLSYALSYALNNVEWLQTLVASVMSSTAMFETEGSSTSVIPTALSMGTWLGVIAVSVFSGVYPAQRAMQLSSLDAIRNSD
ncbi:MAG: ABC transporter permease [Clostridia bacterium]|nr:ABC transporter permease [Clostridia bacterium]